jgi:hypothetical protein
MYLIYIFLFALLSNMQAIVAAAEKAVSAALALEDLKEANVVCGKAVPGDRKQRIEFEDEWDFNPEHWDVACACVVSNISTTIQTCDRPIKTWYWSLSFDGDKTMRLNLYGVN